MRAGDVIIVKHKECGLYLEEYVTRFRIPSRRGSIFGIRNRHNIMSHRKESRLVLGEYIYSWSCRLVPIFFMQA